VGVVEDNPGVVMPGMVGALAHGDRGMTELEVMERLNKVFAGLFRRDDLVLQPATTAADVPGWDSFKQIEIVVAVEEHFQVKLRTREIVRLRNIGDLVALIAGNPQAS
jgi:acyl carrier protein